MNLSEQAVGYKFVTISDGTKLSNPIKFEDGVFPVGIFHPAITTSTDFIFQVSRDGVTYVPFTDAGADYAVTIDNTTPSYVKLTPADFAGIKWLKVEVADNQTGDKAIYLMVRGV